MKVEIKVPFGSLELELTDRQALALFHQATTYAVANVPCSDGKAVSADPDEPEPEKTTPPTEQGGGRQ